jgi:hypothetical protein
MAFSIAGSKTSFWPRAPGDASRVRSSQVGPSPPVVMTTSARAQLSRNCAAMASASSVIVTLRCSN